MRKAGIASQEKFPVTIKLFFSGIYNGEIECFRRIFDPHFKGYEELLAEASFLMTNSNPYLDYVRPLLHKNVPIGGITVTLESNKNRLTEEWDSVLSKRNTTVLVSFGSVAKGIYIPRKYRQTLLKVFESMPDTMFILKYEEDSSVVAVHLPNVHFSRWVPQNAMLGKVK
ncbi:hypothetical protein OESDEN_14256 [Oesophagostomum dentatum]|uniref:glucuronosyltransferase n=1 Tax=Oesophagostomum dentatum TaxID=61180 RepID=A0A0B1SQ36_OESDE|nr:hypothetical protein OESDEN_14256 [Oesophagostomum dentatum]